MRLAVLLIAGLIAVCVASEREGRQFFRFWNKNRDNNDYEPAPVRQRPGSGDRRYGNADDSDWGVSPFNSQPNPPRTRQQHQQQPNKEEKNSFRPFFPSRQNWEGFGQEESWGPPPRQNTREEPSRHHNAEEKRKPSSRPQQEYKDEELSFDYDNDGPSDQPERPVKTGSPVVKNTQQQNPFDNENFPFEAPAADLSKTKPENFSPSPTRGKPLKENGDSNFELPIYRTRQEPQKTFHRPNRPSFDEQEAFVPSKPSSFDVQSAFQNRPSSQFRPEEPPAHFKDTQVFDAEPQRPHGKDSGDSDRQSEDYQGFVPQNFGFGQESPRPSFNEKPVAPPAAPKRPLTVPKQDDEFNPNSEEASFNSVPPNRPVSQRLPGKKERRPPLVPRPPFAGQTNQAKQPGPIDGQSDTPVTRQRLPDTLAQRPRPLPGQGGRPGLPVMETLKNLMGIGARQPQQPQQQPSRPVNRPRPQAQRVRPQPNAPEGLGNSDGFGPFSPQGEQKESAPQISGSFFDDSGKTNLKTPKFPGFPQVSSRQQVSQKEPMEHREMERMSAKSSVQVGPVGMDTTPWTPMTSATESSPAPVSEATSATPQRASNFDSKRQNPRINNYKQRLEAMRERAKQQVQAQHSISRQDDDVDETADAPKPPASSTTTTVRPTSSRLKYPPRMQLRKSTPTTETPSESTKSSLNRRSDDETDKDAEDSLSVESQSSPVTKETTESKPEALKVDDEKQREVGNTSAEVAGDSREEATTNLKNHKLEYSDNFFKPKSGKDAEEVTEDSSEELRQNWYFANQPYVSADLMSDAFVSPSPKSGKQK